MCERPVQAKHTGLFSEGIVGPNVLFVQFDLMTGGGPQRPLPEMLELWTRLREGDAGASSTEPIDAVMETIVLDDEEKGTFGSILTETQWEAWKGAVQWLLETYNMSGLARDIKHVVVFGSAYLPIFTFFSAELMRQGMGGALLHCINFPFNSAIAGPNPTLFTLGPEIGQSDGEEKNGEEMKGGEEGEEGTGTHDGCEVTTTTTEGPLDVPPLIFVGNNRAYKPAMSDHVGALHCIIATKGEDVVAILDSRAVKRIRSEFQVTFADACSRDTEIFIQAAATDAVALALGQMMSTSIVGNAARISMGIRAGPTLYYRNLGRV